MIATLAPSAYIVGPNSAGKSTLVESIALAEKCLQRARQKSPSLLQAHRGEHRKAYPLPVPIVEEGEDPVRHDFGRDAAHVAVFWNEGHSLHMVWPEAEGEQEDGPGYFYLELADGSTPRSISAVKQRFDPISLVPNVTPLDRFEELKDPAYIKRLSSTRLASRHFRNHALQMKKDGSWDAFCRFADDWMPEIKLREVEFYLPQNRLAIYYTEPGSLAPKEIAWAGDGIQIWLQLLWHIYRSRESRIILLDEPEVYLHPDLQRRLVRLLDSISSQVILATHSADVIAEAAPESVVWIDRRSGRANRVTSTSELSALSSSLGTTFNLALARSDRSKIVLATDCPDLRVLRRLARQVGAMRLADDQSISIVQLRDVSAWAAVDRLGEVLRALLPPAVPAIILLQAGQRPSEVNDRIANDLLSAGNQVIRWSRAELSNYILNPNSIARLSGAAPEAVHDRIEEALINHRDVTRAEFCAQAVRAACGTSPDLALSRSEEEFAKRWTIPGAPLSMVRGSLLLTSLNKWLEADGYHGVSDLELAKAVRPQELPSEVFSVLLNIDELAA